VLFIRQIMKIGNQIFFSLQQAGLALFVLAGVAAAQDAATGSGINDALRIRINGMRVLGEADLKRLNFTDEAAGMVEFRKNIVPIKPNQSVRLTVETIDRRGNATAVTAHPLTQYQSLSPWRLTVSPQGVITVTPREESPAKLGRPDTVGDAGILIVFDDPRQPAWNKVFFNILP
jgi:hypothetical protein